MSKKKICFIAQFPPPIHGLSKAVETLYNSELAEKFKFEKVDITDNKKFLKNFIYICKSDADLFYFTISQTKGGNLRDLVILKLLELQQKKCLIHLHGGYYRKLVDYNLLNWQRKKNYKAIRKLAGVIVLGKSLKTNFSGMISEEKIFTVPNCVDNEYLMNDSEFEEKVVTIDQRPIKHVLYLSNFIKTKGYLEVLEMAKREKEYCCMGKNQKLHFNFAGKFFEKKEEDFFFEYIKNNKLEQFVTYHGIVAGNKKRELLKLCDVFVLLTRYPNEGQPISILEAMGNGMLVVTTNHAGIPDIVKEGINGIVVDKEIIDIDDCYDRLIKLVTTDTILSDICSRNRKLITNEYSQTIYIENMGKLFTKGVKA